MEIDVEMHAQCDGWVALFINGRLYRQDDESDMFENWLLRQFHENNGPITIKSLEYHYHEGDEVADYVEKHGRFPEKLSDIHQLINPFQD